MKVHQLIALTLLAILLVSVAPLAAQDATECGAGFRLIDHMAGSDCIPETVERVAVFDTGATELLLALNYPPVARSAFLEQFQLAVLPELEAGLTDLTGALPDMGFPINIEVLLEAAPEVIITNEDFASLFPENIETIAPLIVLSRNWEEKLLKTAEVVGEVEATEAYLAAYEDRVQAVQELLAGEAEIHLSLVRVQNEDFLIYLPGTFGGTILTDVGILRPDAQLELEPETPDYYYVSRERLDLLDGDIIFLFIAYPDPEIITASQALIDELADDPVFQSLSATENDAVYQVGGHWYGDGIYSAHKVLDDIFTIIAGVDPAEVSPNPFLTDATTEEVTPEATEAPSS